jgi:hypothetical protein
MAEWLLNHGADADVKNRLRFKPVDYVAGAMNAALAELLERHIARSQAAVERRS